MATLTKGKRGRPSTKTSTASKTHAKNGKMKGAVAGAPIVAQRQFLPIDDAVPMPTTVRLNGVAAMVDFAAMEVGHSVFVPNKTKTAVSSAANTWGTKYYDETREDRRFSVREWAHNGVSGARVWRVQ
jgi:hypothetical protein